MFSVDSLSLAVEEVWQLAMAMASLKYIAGMVRQEVETVNTAPGQESNVQISIECKRQSSDDKKKPRKKKAAVKNENILHKENTPTFISSLNSHALPLMDTSVEPEEAQSFTSMLAHYHANIEAYETEPPKAEPDLLTSFVAHQLPSVDTAAELSEYPVSMAAHVVLGNDIKDGEKIIETDSGLTGSMLAHQISNEDRSTGQEITNVIQAIQTQENRGQFQTSNVSNMQKWVKNDCVNNVEANPEIPEEHNVMQNSVCEEIVATKPADKTLIIQRYGKKDFGSYSKFVDAAKTIFHNTVDKSSKCRISRIHEIEQNVEDEIEEYERRKESKKKDENVKITEYTVASNVKGVEFQLHIVIHESEKVEPIKIEGSSIEAENSNSFNLPISEYKDIDNEQSDFLPNFKLQETQKMIKTNNGEEYNMQAKIKTDHQLNRDLENKDESIQDKIALQNEHDQDSATIQFMHEMNKSEESLEDYKAHLMKVKTNPMFLEGSIGSAMEELWQLAKTMEMTMKYICGIISQDLKEIGTSQSSEPEEINRSSNMLSYQQDPEEDHIEQELFTKDTDCEFKDRFLRIKHHAEKQEAELALAEYKEELNIPILLAYTTETKSNEYSSDPFLITSLVVHQVPPADTPFTFSHTMVSMSTHTIAPIDQEAYEDDNEHCFMTSMLTHHISKEDLSFLEPEIENLATSMLLPSYKPVTTGQDIFNKNQEDNQEPHLEPDNSFLPTLCAHHLTNIDIPVEYSKHLVSMSAHGYIPNNTEDGDVEDDRCLENDPGMRTSMVSHQIGNTDVTTHKSDDYLTEKEECLSSLESSEVKDWNIGTNFIKDMAQQKTIFPEEILNVHVNMKNISFQYENTKHPFLSSMAAHQLPFLETEDEFPRFLVSTTAHRVSLIEEEDSGLLTSMVVNQMKIITEDIKAKPQFYPSFINQFNVDENKLYFQANEEESADEVQSDYCSSMVSHQVPSTFDLLEYPDCITSMAAHQDIQTVEETEDSYFDNNKCLVSMVTHTIDTCKDDGKADKNTLWEENICKVSEPDEYIEQPTKCTYNDIQAYQSRVLGIEEQTSEEVKECKNNQNDATENNVIISHQHSIDDADNNQLAKSEIILENENNEKTEVEVGNNDNANKICSEDILEQEILDKILPRKILTRSNINETKIREQELLSSFLKESKIDNPEEMCKKIIKIKGKGSLETKVGKGKKQTFKIKFRVKLTSSDGSSSPSSVLQYLCSCLTGEKVSQAQH